MRKSYLQFELKERRELTGIPSASGIEITPFGTFVLGDDAPWLFKLEEDLSISEKILLIENLPLVNEVFEKAIKPDLEALCRVSQEGDRLYAFGSGSKSPQRDLLLEIDLKSSSTLKMVSLSSFYQSLRAQAKLTIEQFNIEAAEISGDFLFLFNRGKNRIFKISLEQFKEYLEGAGEVPTAAVYPFTLPQINGIEAGFSGVTFHPLEEAFIFTATVEDTSNWIDDGEVLGSFIGVLGLGELEENSSPECLLIKSDQHIIKIKVESIAVVSPIFPKRANLVLVSDSDGGVSEILKGELSFYSE